MENKWIYTCERALLVLSSIANSEPVYSKGTNEIWQCAVVNWKRPSQSRCGISNLVLGRCLSKKKSKRIEVIFQIKDTDGCGKTNMLFPLTVAIETQLLIGLQQILFGFFNFRNESGEIMSLKDQ